MDHNSQNRSNSMFDPNNRVIGIIDSPDNAQAAVELLNEQGFEDKKLDVLVGAESAKRFGVDGSPDGILANLATTVRKYSDAEIEILKGHVKELQAGHVFFSVETDGTEAQIKQVSDILAGNLAHDVYFFGGEAVRRLSA